MSKRTLLSVLGIVGISVASVAHIVHVGLSSQFADTKSSSFQMEDSNGLMAGARVLLSGVTIGEVSEVKAGVDTVDVTVQYDSSVDIPSGSSFRVDNLSALGEPYVLITPEGEDNSVLADGDSVPAEQVLVPTSFKELSERLTRTLTQVDGERVERIFDELNTALPDDRAVYDALARSGDLFASEITLQGDNFEQMLLQLQPLLMNSEDVPAALRDSAPHLQGFAAGLNSFLEGVRFAAEFGPLTRGIEEGVSPAIAEIQAFLDASAPDLQILGKVLLQPVTEASSTLQSVDLSHLLQAALRDMTGDGAVTVHVGVAGK